MSRLRVLDGQKVSRSPFMWCGGCGEPHAKTSMTWRDGTVLCGGCVTHRILREAERGDGEAMSRALVVIRVLLAMVALIVALGALGWILVHVMPVDRSN